MSASTLKTLLRAHRWIGLILCVPLLLWAVTGVLHPIMSATQPQPTKRMPPPQVLDLTVVRPLPAVLQQSGYQHITQAQVVQLSQNQLAYRIVDNQTIGYYAADTGQPLPQGEQQHLSRLVAWYTDRPVSTIQHIQRVDQFNDDYPSVNRILPVWRVDLEHGLRAYLDPSQDRLVTLSNDPKYWMSRLFRLGHTWSWDEAQLPADRWLKTIVLLGGIGIAIVGLLLFIRLKNRKGQRLVSRPMQRWHRRMGVVAALFAICWMLSGLLHLWQKTPHPSPSPAVFAVDQLSHQGWQAATQHPIKRLDLVAFDRHGSDSQPAWLVRPLTSIAVGAMTADKHEHQHHAAHQAGDIPDFRLFVAESGVELPDGVQQQAKNLARFYANLSTDQIGETQWVTRFSGEYGFINKRLPVLKVNTTQADGLRLYIEPSTGALAAQVTDWDAFEGTVFGYLHKWNMLPLPKLLRDAMLGLMAGLFGLVVLLGCSMAYFRLRHRQK